MTTPDPQPSLEQRLEAAEAEKNDRLLLANEHYKAWLALPFTQYLMTEAALKAQSHKDGATNRGLSQSQRDNHQLDFELFDSLASGKWAAWAHGLRILRINAEYRIDKQTAEAQDSADSGPNPGRGAPRGGVRV